MKRVLKPQGKAYFMEPLGHNPLINFYRAITPKLRSKDETPLRFEQFETFRNLFSRFEHEDYYFLTMFALFWHFLGAKKPLLKTRDMLMKLDDRILGFCPLLRKHCWYSILEFQK